MSPSLVRVIKLGGSLLDWPPLVGRLRRWIAAQSPAANVVVVGGGEFAEEVRRLDGVHHLSPRDAHWLAAESMQITARLVSLLLPESQGIKRFDELLAAANPENGIVIFDAWQFLREVESTLPGERLPEDWSTTSDSIAARLAAVLRADELVLLKSALPAGMNKTATAVEINELAATGYVDAALPRIATGLKQVRCVNLRDKEFAECLVQAS